MINSERNGTLKGKGIRIVATGRALPKKVITNDDLSKIVDTSDEWIVSRTGIKSRFQCEDESCVSLAVEAAKKAMEAAGIDKNDVGAIICASSTSDHVFPAVASMIQSELGFPEELTAFDICAACTGFLFGLQTAQGLLNSIEKRYVLLVASEQLSRIVDYSDRGTCILFGDGAAAAVVTATDGQYVQKSWCRGNKEALSCAGVGMDNAHILMNGTEVFRFATTALAQAVEETLKEADKSIDDVDYIVCHQANERIIRHVQKKYPGREDRFFINIDKYGNTSAASIPIALDEMMEQKLLKRGMKVLCVGFGAGLTWSGALIEI